MVHQLLQEKSIKTIITDESIEEYGEQGENIYKLHYKDNKWVFLFVQWEKKNGKENVLKVFDDKETAIKYFYFYKLNDYYFAQYIRLFKSNNRDLNVGRPEFNYENLKFALRRAAIPERYYSLNGKLKEHSIILEQVDDWNSKVEFIGKNRRVYSETLVLENWDIYSELFKNAYFLYLLDQECERLIERGIIHKRFTDEEYDSVLYP